MRVCRLDGPVKDWYDWPMIKPKIEIEKALQGLKKCRELAQKLPSPLKGKTKAQILKELRQNREELWQETYGPSKNRPRHQ